MPTNRKIAQAREWANLHLNISNHRLNARVKAAADIIRDLPDEWVDASKLRDVINEQLASHPHGTAGHHVAEDIACKLEALFPAPQPRTLADMDYDERSACQWMQVQVHGVPYELGTIIYLTEYHATVLWHDGTTTLREHRELTPLPDLPRMVWPDGHHATTRHHTGGK